MSATDTIYGGDETVRVTAYQKGTTIPVDLTQYVVFGLIVYIDNTPIQKYCSATVTGYKETTAVSLANGVFDIDLYREDLAAVKNGNVIGKVFGYVTNADFLDDKKTTIGVPFVIAVLDKNTRTTPLELGYTPTT